uniref:Uncharacterized protein n=1 Tax=Panagrolaimus sp. ES5 TaxID=591445 RepID=A0AC34G0J6_9BILA
MLKIVAFICLIFAAVEAQRGGARQQDEVNSFSGNNENSNNRQEQGFGGFGSQGSNQFPSSNNNGGQQQGNGFGSRRTTQSPNGNNGRFSGSQGGSFGLNSEGSNFPQQGSQKSQFGNRFGNNQNGQSGFGLGSGNGQNGQTGESSRFGTNGLPNLGV